MYGLEEERVTAALPLRLLPIEDASIAGCSDCPYRRNELWRSRRHQLKTHYHSTVVSVATIFLSSRFLVVVNIAVSRHCCSLFHAIAAAELLKGRA